METGADYFDVIEAGAGLLQLRLNQNPPVRKRVIALHQVVMRGESEIPASLREALAAFVSRLNMCSLCYKAHSKVAELLGFSACKLESAAISVEHSALAIEEKALFDYARILTCAPSAMDETYYVEAVRANWSKEALNDAICVICLYNFINRYVLAHGIRISDRAIEKSAHFIASNGYWDLKHDKAPTSPRL